jgi:hypothetical protein
MNERRKWPDDYMGDEDENQGVRCRKCGCRHLLTRNTIPIGDGACRRYKVCRNCGTVVRTVERTG